MNPERLMAHSFPAVTQVYDDTFTMLYALSIGIGQDPLDERQLRFVYEDGLLAFPTMAVVLATPGFWARDPRFGIDWTRVLHGEQALEIHRALPAAGRVSSTLRVAGIDDKGPDKGAVVHTERTVSDADTGEPIATLRQTTFARADGGCGGDVGHREQVWHRPQRSPDHICSLATGRNSALVYRLTGDRNPLHADPVIARAAGFNEPILHGLCTFGVIAHALVRTLADYRATRLRAVSGRFSSPVVPGQVISTAIWAEAGGILFESTVPGGRCVFTRGRAEVEG